MSLFGAQNMMSKEAIIALVIVGLIAVAGISYGVCELTDEHGKCEIDEVRVNRHAQGSNTYYEIRLVGDCCGTDNGYFVKYVDGSVTLYIDDLSKTYTVKQINSPYLECPHGIHKLKVNFYWPYD